MKQNHGWYALLFLLFCGQTLAETCAVPYLASGFCDRNGDMVADVPDDQSFWLDPDPIIIADAPTTDMSKGAEQLAPFLRHLEKATGRKVNFFIARDYADLLAAFKDNRVHVLQVNTGSVEREVRCHGYIPIAQPVDAKGNVDGYQMEFLVPAKSTIKAMSELRGHAITFVDENSASGYQIPLTILAHEFGLKAGKDYSVDFSGRQDSSVVGVANGIYAATPVASLTRARLSRDGLIDPAAVRVIYTSKVLPRSPWGVSHRLNPALVSNIRAAFVNYTGPDTAFKNVGRLRASNYKSDWAFMRELSAASGAPIKCK